MFETAQCPNCHEQVNIPADQFGQPVTCPGCHQLFVGQTPAPSPADGIRADLPAAPPVLEVADTSPDPVVPTESDAGLTPPDEWYQRSQLPEANWGQVHRGVCMLLIGTTTWFLTSLLLLLIPGSIFLPRAMLGLGTVGLVLIVYAIAVGMILIGLAYCIYAPSQHLAKELAIFSMILTVIGMPTSFVGVYLVFREVLTYNPRLPVAPRLEPFMFCFLGGILLTIAGFLHLYFQRSLSRVLNDEELVSKVNGSLLLAWLIVGTNVCMVAYVTLTAPPPGQYAPGHNQRLFQGAGCFMTILWLLLMCCYLLTTDKLRRRLANIRSSAPE